MNNASLDFRFFFLFFAYYCYRSWKEVGIRLRREFEAAGVYNWFSHVSVVDIFAPEAAYTWRGLLIDLVTVD